MAAARHIPHHFPEKERAAATWPVNFLYNGTTLTNSAEAFKGVSAGDTVTFSNSASSTAPIVITFAANPPIVPTPPPGAPLFNVTTITLAPGANSPQTVVPANGSVNYIVSVNGAQVGGPYAIQVGAGPLYVEITSMYSQPDPIAVPAGGTLEIYSNDSNTYTIKWPAAFNPFPTISEAKPGAGNNTPGTQVGPAQVYAYTFSVKLLQGNGGGTVKVLS